MSKIKIEDGLAVCISVLASLGGVTFFFSIVMLTSMPEHLLNGEYHEDCIQSHVEYNETKEYGSPEYAIFDSDNTSPAIIVGSNFANPLTLNVNYSSRTLGSKIYTIKNQKTVCDKYALVRDARNGEE